MVKIYGIKNCGTVKKALRWLEEAGCEYEFIAYKNAAVLDARLKEWLIRAGWQTLLNTRGLTWKKLEAAEREKLDAEKAEQLMRRYPTLIKRPILERDGEIIVGFDAERYAGK
ncbi:MAG: Spx/MgsR family RNA polymerase-binding regulatory protein [Zoogloeaceae bacterium]|jgi:arsenate reductase|nr:Spx/MgsR family RNA polymerase-binding regulatory protein [Zoogloeaceae bacterium]